MICGGYFPGRATSNSLLINQWGSVAAANPEVDWFFGKLREDKSLQLVLER